MPLANSHNPHNASWQQTMLRIKDPKKTIPFYQEHFGFTLIDKYDFPEANFSLYFLATLPEGEKIPGEPGTPEAHKYLWNFKGTCLELTHNYGTENDESFKYNNGNVEPNRGFGHIAVFTDDVYAVCEELEKAGVKFQKRPNEGRMKGLAFALDPDGYWIEIIKRAENTGFKGYTLSQTMIRVKDPAKSVPFYRDHFGMSVIGEKHFPDAKFSLFFLASIPAGEEVPEPRSEASSEFMKRLFNPVLELTHNHGTESDPNFSYHNGNTEPRGFGHIGFLVDNAETFSNELENAGVQFQKKPNEGKIKGIAFAKDPDGYWVEIIPRNFSVNFN